MADISLQAKPLLGAFESASGPVNLKELTELAIVSMAIPQGDEAGCTEKLRAAFGATLPENGRTCLSADGKTRFLRTQPDQLFALFIHADPDARKVVHNATEGAFWTTDQTDVWCALEISGPQAREALARICPLDLHPESFGPDHMGRTVMEHLGAIIFRTGEDSFALMSARSSAQSFLHAVTQSIENIL